MSFIKGRGSQYNPNNKFFQQQVGKYYDEGIDDWENEDHKTSYTEIFPKTLVHKVESPDVGMSYSANPYQGCEHGCIYCYARNSHNYWGFSSGLEFEHKILVKTNSAELFEDFINKKSWDPTPISFSGNTDCYQPAERKFELMRKILLTALEQRQPISIITKNSLVLRDLDILREMAAKDLCMVYVSLNSLTEATRRKLEPRTSTAAGRLKTMEALAENGIPTGIMCAPIIPGLTDHEIVSVLSAARDVGVRWAGRTIVRLNGQLGELFADWLQGALPDRADKIWNLIKSCHHDQVNNSTFGNRMVGSGKYAAMISDTFDLTCKRLGLNSSMMELNSADFRRRAHGQLSLF